MKKDHYLIKIVCKIIIVLLYPFLCVNAQERMTYSGPFTIETRGYNGSEKGTATYSYTPLPDRKRSFDGTFHFINDHMDVKGQFENDYQIGEWVWIRYNEKLIIHFDKNGHPNGDFSYTCNTERLNGTIRYVKGLVSDRNIAITYFNYTNPEKGYVAKGKMNHEWGQIYLGTWYLKTGKKDPLITTIWNNKNECYYIEEFTGDKKRANKYWSKATFISDTCSHIYYLISSLCMRHSKL